MTLKSTFIKFNLHLLWFTASVQSSGNFEVLQLQILTRKPVCFTGELLGYTMYLSRIMKRIKTRRLASARYQFEESVATLSDARVSPLPLDRLIGSDTGFLNRAVMGNVPTPPGHSRPQWEAARCRRRLSPSLTQVLPHAENLAAHGHPHVTVPAREGRSRLTPSPQN